MFFVMMKEVIPSSWWRKLTKEVIPSPRWRTSSWWRSLRCDEEISPTLLCSAASFLLPSTCNDHYFCLNTRITMSRVLLESAFSPLHDHKWSLPAWPIFPVLVSFFGCINRCTKPPLNAELSNLTSTKREFRETRVFWYEWYVIYAQIALK